MKIIVRNIGMLRKEDIKLIPLLWIVLSSLSCAPIVGTSRIVFQSAPEKPHWIQVIPQSRTYQYFVGISDNFPTLDEAKRHAVVDAFEEAIALKGIEVSVNYEKLATEQKRIIRDSVDIRGIFQLGLERVAWYYEEWEQILAKGARKFFRAFVLMRSRKLKPSSPLITSLQIMGQRLDATWHSMLLPGWGQKRYGKKGKSKYFFYTTFLSGGVWLGSSLYYEKFRKDRSDLEEDLLLTTDEVDRQEILEKISDLEDRLRDTKKIRKNAAAITVGFYVLNLVDALLFGPPSYRSYAGVDIEPKLFVLDSRQAPALGVSVSFRLPLE